MKKIKVLVVCMFTMLMMSMLTGCQSEVSIDVNKDGSGVFAVDYTVEKDCFEDSMYKVKSTKETVALLKENAKNDFGFTVKEDYTSSVTEDYVTLEYKFNSIEELNKKLLEIRSSINDCKSFSNETYDVSNLVKNTVDEYLTNEKIEHDIESDVFNYLCEKISYVVYDNVDTSCRSTCGYDLDQMIKLENGKFTINSDVDFFINKLIYNNIAYENKCKFVDEVGMFNKASEEFYNNNKSIVMEALKKARLADGNIQWYMDAYMDPAGEKLEDLTIEGIDCIWNWKSEVEEEKYVKNEIYYKSKLSDVMDAASVYNYYKENMLEQFGEYKYGSSGIVNVSYNGEKKVVDYKTYLHGPYAGLALGDDFFVDFNETKDESTITTNKFEDAKEDIDDTPKTGDKFSIVIMMMIVMVATIGCVITYRIRKTV